MRAAILRFLIGEDSGAVTVDWIVLAAIVTALGASVMPVVLGGDAPLGTATADLLRSAAPE